MVLLFDYTTSKGILPLNALNMIMNMNKPIMVPDQRSGERFMLSLNKVSQTAFLGRKALKLEVYKFFANKITRSFNMVLLGEINNSNKYIIKIS